MNSIRSSVGRPDQKAGRTSRNKETIRIVSSRYIVPKTNISRANGVGICFRPRSTYNSFVSLFAGWVAFFGLEFFVTFFFKKKSLEVKRYGENCLLIS
jgi:hypothetical protein